MIFKKLIYQEMIIEHYKKNWNNSPNLYLWDKGPIDKLPFDFRVLEYPPSTERKMWTYATCGLSQPEDEFPIELHLFSSIKDSSIVELLTAVAYYHRNTQRIGLNDTINFGKPWQGQSECEYGFISLPYLEGPSLENLTLKNKHLVKFYWIIPIFEKEADYKHLNGAEALEARFEETEFDYLNPNRKIKI